MSNPHIGQRATFYPGGGRPHVSGTVEFVFGPHCVNLRLDHAVQFGGSTLMTSVLVYDSDMQRPSGYYCVLASGEDRIVDDGKGGKRLVSAVELVRVNAAETAKEAAPAPVTAAIKGYRQLPAADQALINECKELAEKCGAMVARLRAMQPSPPTGPVPASPSTEDPLGQRSTIDQRWVSIGATHLQEGWMAIVRGIAQPSNF